MNKPLSETLIQQAEAAVDNGQSLETVLQTLEQWAAQHPSGAETLLPSLLTTNLLFAGIDLAAAIPGFSSTQRSRIQTPLMNASEQAAALDWNRRKHPAVSGITLEKISVALARYVDFARVEQAITNYNTLHPEAPILVESRPDNAVLVEAIHQFQLKCYLEPDQHDGLAGESVLDNLGLIDRSGMHSVDKPYSTAQSRLNSKARQVEREAGGGITARNWFKHMVNPTFLGQRFTKGIHLILIRKLRQVEQLFFDQSADTTPVELGQRFGVVADDPHRGMRFRGSGNHTFGLAFDLKYRGNPWVAGNPDRPNGNRYFDQAMDRAVRLMAGETSFSFTAGYLHGLAQRLTTTEIHQELSRRDGQLRAYLRLANDRAQLQQTLEARRATGTAGVFSSAGESIEVATARWTRQISTDLRALRSYFEPGRDPRNGFLNLPLELIVALRDRACMAWGAVDFGSNQSGDVMHFDLRVTGVGKVLSRHSPRVHPCITSGGSETVITTADAPTVPPAMPYGETVLHQCRPGEGPPAAVPDPKGKGLHPLVYRGTTRQRSRNPSVGDAQQLLNRFLQQISGSLSVCTVRTAEVQRFIARGRATLQSNGQDPLVVDCRFGASTETAVKMFQACRGLSRDGKIGPLTWAELVKLRTPPGPCLVVPTASTDPSALNLSPVGQQDYTGTVTILGRPTRVNGIVFYPAQRAGTGTPFNRRIAAQGPAPIVAIAHGNHSIFHDPADRFNEVCVDPGGFTPIANHKGHVYFQQILARMGIISISVDCNSTNCAGLSPTNILQRAILILGSIKHFQTLNSGGDPIFGNHIDFTKVALLGHSRGGEAVVAVPDILASSRTIGVSGVTIKGIISLAPTDTGASHGRPNSGAYMAILPAGDGDVISNDGAKFYDQATPNPFKCQLYVRKANHNFFNTEWPGDDGHGPPVMADSDHRRILSVYGSAFLRQVLLGQSFANILTGKELPPGVPTQNVQLSFELPSATTVDDHENRNISLNTLAQPTVQAGGLTAAEFDFVRGSSRAFNNTFFGNTQGMVAQSSSRTGQFRSQLSSPTDLTDREIWLRTAEVYDGSAVPPGATGFELGLEDNSGRTVFVDSDEVGSLPRPYDRRADDFARIGRDFTKTMLTTLRFPARCFSTGLDITQIRAILLRLDRGDRRAIAFDQLQIL